MVSLIPLGGYVKPLGESPGEEIPDSDRPFSLNHQSKIKRFGVLFAGSFFNLVFATIIFSFIYMSGTPMLISKVGQVMENSPAANAGIIPDDIIESVNGKEIKFWTELTEAVEHSNGKNMTLRLNRNNQGHVVQLTPELVDSKNMFGEDVKMYRIGIASSSSKDSFVIQKYSLPVALWKGIQDTCKWSKLTLVGMGVLARNPVKRRADIGGPILIGKLAGDFARAGLTSFVMLMAMISVNIGVLNLLPIPVLDGGHILSLLIEAVKGKPVNIKNMETAQQIGLVFLLILMAFVFYNDITRFFPN